MSVQLVLKNSSVQDKEATAAQLAVGELALNYHSSGPFLQCEDSAGNIWRLGGVVIASTAPSSPSKGAWWLDSDDNHLYFYNGSSWIEIQTGEIVPGDITEGTARQLLQTNAAGNGTEWTSNIDVPGTLDVTGVATFDNNVVITGNLTVNGTTTTIDTTTLVVEDKNIELGVVGTPTDTTADGGGITVKGATDKTLTWVNSTGAWTSNQPLDVNGEVECDGIANGTSSVTIAQNSNIDLVRGGTTQASVTADGLKFSDGRKAVFGTGDELGIYHDGTNSYINQDGAGHLYIRNNVDDKDVIISTDDGAGGLAAYVYCDGSTGETKLHHYGSQKLATTSGGINVTGTVQANRIDAVNTGGPMLILKDSDSSGNSATMYLEGQDSLGAQKWYVGDTNTNGDIRIRNTQSGSLVLGTNNADYAIIDPTGNFIPDTTNSYDLGTSSKQWRNGYFDGTVNCDGLDVDGTASINRLVVDDDGSASPTAVIKADDNGPWALCIKNDSYSTDENHGLKFYQNNTGECDIQLHGGSSYRSLTFRQYDGSTQRNTLNLNANSSVQLYYDGNEKLVTTSTGIDVTGEVQCDGLTVGGNATINGLGTIQNSTGVLLLRDSDSTTTSNVNYIEGRNNAGSAYWQLGHASSGTDHLYVTNVRNAAILFSTNNTTRCYVDNTGHFVPNANNTYDLGSSSSRWRDIYTQDIDVNGTSTLQGKVVGIERTATASSFDLNNGNMWTFGAIAVPNPTNQSAGMMGSLRVTAAPTSFAANWKFPGGSYTAPTSFPAVAPFFVQASGTILVGSWTEGIA